MFPSNSLKECENKSTNQVISWYILVSLCLEPRHDINVKHLTNTWMFPKIGVPQNGWFTMENPIKMDDLGVPLFLETPNSYHHYQ